MGDTERRIVDAGSARPYRSPKQRRQILIAAMVTVLVAGIGVGAYYLITPHAKTYVLTGYETAVVKSGDLAQTASASGTVSIPVQISLPSPEEGYTAGLYVAEGDTVKVGQVLAKISVPTLTENLADQQSALEEAQASYEKAVAQDKVDVDRKVREIAALDTDIATQTKERDRLAKLVAINATHQSELDAAQQTLDKTVASQKEKQMQLLEDQGLYALDEKTRLSSIEDLKTKVSRLEDRITAATLTSPMVGEVQSVSSALGVPGTLISAGASLVTVADPSSAIVELEVLEQYAGYLSAGQSVKLTVGSKSLTGKITSIGRVATQSSDGLGATVVVKVKPDAGAATLLAGNTAEGELDLGTKKDVLQIPRGPYLTTGSQRYLYKVQGNTARRLSVTFGSTEGNTVEVLSGVTAGDTVITSGYQNFIDYEQITLKK